MENADSVKTAEKQKKTDKKQKRNLCKDIQNMTTQSEGE